jgi:hypothetical protein
MMLLSFGDETHRRRPNAASLHPKHWLKQWAIPRQALPPASLLGGIAGRASDEHI